MARLTHTTKAAYASVSKNTRSDRQEDSDRREGLGLRKISTLNGEKLIVSPQNDIVFDAARSLFHQNGLGNVLFIGDAGSGKTRRAESLTLGENYPVFLDGTTLANIEVHIHSIEVDLISTSASSELLYDSRLEGGSFSRHAAIVADFILTHGTTDPAEFEARMQANRRVLETGQGIYTLYFLMLDDFDRTFRELQNSFLKLIHGVRHRFQRLNVPPYYLRLQCIATSNSSLGIPSGKYTAAAGRLDAAVANRFQIYWIPDADFENILVHHFPEEAGFCRMVAQMARLAKKMQKDGELESLGEISLRQVMPIIEHKIRYGISNEDAALRFFTALPDSGDERMQANLIMSQLFDKRSKKMDQFAGY